MTDGTGFPVCLSAKQGAWAFNIQVLGPDTYSLRDGMGDLYLLDKAQLMTFLEEQQKR